LRTSVVARLRRSVDFKGFAPGTYYVNRKLGYRVVMVGRAGASCRIITVSSGAIWRLDCDEFLARFVEEGEGR